MSRCLFATTRRSISLLRQTAIARRGLATHQEPAFPTVSFAPFLSGNDAEQRRCAQSIYDSLHEYGWIYLKDHGIPQHQVDELWRVSKSYFHQPLSHKLPQRLSISSNQGYTPDGAESASGTDHKECYEHRRFSNPLCPSTSSLPGFLPFMNSFYDSCFSLSTHLLRALSLVMDLPKDYFSSVLANADPQLRLLHYMAIPRETVDAQGHARLTPHTDHGLCTILFQDGIGGLEVDPFHTGEFREGTPVEGTVIVNVADLLERLSNGRLRSTRHRVTAPRVREGARLVKAVDGREMLPERFSTAFFVHPEPSMVVKPMVREGEEMRYETVVAGEWRDMKTKEIYHVPSKG